MENLSNSEKINDNSKKIESIRYRDILSEKVKLEFYDEDAAISIACLDVNLKDSIYKEGLKNNLTYGYIELNEFKIACVKYKGNKYYWHIILKKGKFGAMDENKTMIDGCFNEENGIHCLVRCDNGRYIYKNDYNLEELIAVDDKDLEEYKKYMYNGMVTDCYAPEIYDFYKLCNIINDINKKIFKEKIKCEIVKSLYEKYNVDLNINHHLQMLAINIYYKYGYKLDLIKILSMIVVSELVSLLKILNKPFNGFKYNIKIGIKNYLKDINEKEEIYSLLNELYDRKTEESLFGDGGGKRERILNGENSCRG